MEPLAEFEGFQNEQGGRLGLAGTDEGLHAFCREVATRDLAANHAKDAGDTL